MASHGTAIALPRRRPAPSRPAQRRRPAPARTTGVIGRHRRATTLTAVAPTGPTTAAPTVARTATTTLDSDLHSPVDLESMLVWFVVLLALGLFGVVLSALA